MVFLHAVFQANATELIAYAYVVGMAAFWVGGIVGFIFGVPIHSQSDRRRDESGPEMSGRLAEVADWLTKIVIGVGLVEIRSLIRLVDSVGRSVGEATAIANDGPLFTALVVTSAGTGFWFLYYWSWMYWTRLDAKMRAEVADSQMNDPAVETGQ